jgi:hypothetical protein
MIITYKIAVVSTQIMIVAVHLPTTVTTSITSMAGSKKHKLRKTRPTQPVTSPSTVDKEDDDLVTDLLEQLESRASNARSESTTTPNEAPPTQQGDQTEVSGKQGAKSRFKARQVRCISCQP